MRRVFPFTFIPSHKSDGTVNAGGTVWFYTAGTSTLETTFADFSLSATNSISGVTLDSAGKKAIFLREDRLYDIVEKDSAGNTINTHYNIGQNTSAVLTDLSENVVSNHSFETDTNADGEPDNWTRTVGGGETAAIDATQDYHGTKSFKFISASSASYLVSDPFPVSPAYTLFLSFSRYASNAAAQPKVTVDWLDEAQAAISSSTVYSQTDGATPTSWARIYGLQATPPATARYATLTLYGNQAAASRSTWFDDVRVQLRSAYDGYASATPTGLNFSQDTDADHDIKVTAGSVLDDALTYSLILKSDTVKRLDASWAVGTGNGGMQSGSALANNTLYYCYLIGASGTGAVDMQWVPAGTAFSAPSGYDKKRYIGAWRTNGTAVLTDGVSRGNIWEWLEVSVADVTDTTVTASAFETGTMIAPPYCTLHHNTRLESLTATASELFVQVRPYGATWISGKFGSGVESTTDDIDEVWQDGHVYVDGSRRISYSAVATGHVDPLEMNIYTIGWVDNWRMYP